MIDTLLPATKVSVSLLLSATTVFCPDTATFLNIFWLEPLSEFVIVTDPEVPPPLKPVPALTAVISPWLFVKGKRLIDALVTLLVALLLISMESLPLNVPVAV